MEAPKWFDSFNRCSPLIALLVCAAVGYGLEYINKDPMGTEYEARVKKEIVNCLDATERCMGGTVTFRNGTVTTITPDIVGKMEMMFSFHRTELIREVASVTPKP